MEHNRRDRILEPDRDFETYPTPANPDQRPVIARIEVNMHSLELLTRDLFSFINQADLTLKQPTQARDRQVVDNILNYFIRLHNLLVRIDNDVRGSDYSDLPGATPRMVRDPLQTQEITPALRSQVESVCQTILQNSSLLSEVKPGNLANLISGIEMSARHLQKYFQKNV